MRKEEISNEEGEDIVKREQKKRERGERTKGEDKGSEG